MAADLDWVSRARRCETQLRLEALEWEDLGQRKAVWSVLAGRALEPNAFLEPAFALPAAQHLATLRPPIFLVVSTVSGAGERGEGEMVGLWPLIIPKRGFGTFARTWLHDYATTGTPLLEPSRGAEAFGLMLQWLELTHPHIAGVELPCLAEAGSVATLACARARKSGLDWRALDHRFRAVLAQPEPRALRSEAERRSRTLLRQWRKLAALGRVQYVSRREPKEIRIAMEAFLALEAAGWKGRSGTALLVDPSVVTFARTMTRLLAQEERCRIESLELDGAPLAMLIVLYSGDRAFAWKITYDEAFAAYSPGSQIILEFTERQMREPQVAVIDSCSSPDIPFIDRFWSDKVAIADFFLAVSPNRSAAFQASLSREMLRRNLRRRAKQAYKAMPKPGS